MIWEIVTTYLNENTNLTEICHDSIIINTREGNVEYIHASNLQIWHGTRLNIKKLHLKERNYNFQIPVSYKTSYNLARYFLSIFRVAIAHNFKDLVILHSFTRPSRWLITCTSLNKSSKSEKFIKITPFDKYKKFILQKSNYYSNKSRRVWKLSRLKIEPD